MFCSDQTEMAFGYVMQHLTFVDPGVSVEWAVVVAGCRRLVIIMHWWKRNKALCYVAIPGISIFIAWLSLWIWDAEGIWYMLMVLAALIAGGPISREAWQRLRHKQFSIPLLITVAAIGALWIGEVWEAAAVTFLYKLGSYLESLTLSRTRAALRSLLDLRPLTATVQQDDGTWVEVPADQVKKGQHIMVRPGEKVPVDGEVVQGQAALDTAALTGEPLPKEVMEGDFVLSGSVSRGGHIEVKATRVAADTTFHRLIQLVAQAQSEKPRVQQFLDRFAQWYTPLILLIAFILFVWSKNVYLALTFLVIGCPGALVVAAPVAVVAGLGRAARNGILIKGGERLEQVERVDTMAFDKTGTLTQGQPTVSHIHTFGTEESEVLAYAAAAEQRSEHHLAAAILKYAQQKDVSIPAAGGWQFYPGLGVDATIEDGAYIMVGNWRFMEQHGVTLEAEHKEALAIREAQGDAVAFVAADKKLIGLIGIHDPLRAQAKYLVEALHRVGVRQVAMLTGDNAAAAQRIAGELGIDIVYADLLPEEKVAAIRRMQHEGKVVAMVGDGINDAPALARADVSVAMGTTGTHVTMESADIVLMEDRLDKIPEAINLSRRIGKVIRQNVVVAAGTVLVLLFGVVTHHVGLSLGMLIHEASVLIVIFNGMRLLRNV